MNGHHRGLSSSQFSFSRDLAVASQQAEQNRVDDSRQLEDNWETQRAVGKKQG